MWEARDSVRTVATLKAGDLLSVEQAARVLGVSDDSVRAYVRDGRLPAVRVGGSPQGPIRIRLTDLEEVLLMWQTRG